LKRATILSRSFSKNPSELRFAALYLKRVYSESRIFKLSDSRAYLDKRGRQRPVGPTSNRQGTIMQVVGSIIVARSFILIAFLLFIY